MQQFAFLAVAGALALGGCTTVSDEPADNCRVLESEGWAANVASVPGNPDRNQLTVTGRVTMPTPAYTFAWEAGRLDRSAVPSFELRLLATPPDGMVAQVLDTSEVTYTGPAAAPRYSAITVTCEGRVLARIEDVG
ncbi:hypothetical protein [Allopontixanthobacter sp.]|uniref:hypothetical protein n=1 Tax=Allopontixanthobacter sp. TaxID=2906452 RepID=UPI002AB8B7D0|nr:hypothetical protein [Allopontixanthobacter sp.]MDZ4308687.1 hypothetical protein [Allopontixanthobacter sp.]